MTDPAKRDAKAAARAAHLRYVTDEQPGYSRRRRGKGFSYHAPSGELVRGERELRRFAALAIPPGWRDVWISRDPNGHLQATGRDEAGRKQYIYHPHWTKVRDEVKFASLTTFGGALPALRRRVNRDLRGVGLGRSKLVAAAVKLLDLTLIRVGNAAYARTNRSYGLTTLRDKHVRLLGNEIELKFRGKGGALRDVSLTSDELASVMRQCRELPGYELFRYRGSDGGMHAIDSGDVNDYLRAATGQDLTAKEFRTWGGTVITASALAATSLGVEAGEQELKRAASRAVERAALALGNSPAICRQSYVHPAVLGSFLGGEFQEAYGEALGAARVKKPRELRLAEAATLTFLQRSA